MSDRDPFALGGLVDERPATGDPASVDATALDLFRQWMATMLALDEEPPGVDEREVLYDRLHKVIEPAIIGLSGGGIVTMAVKVYQLARYECCNWAPSGATIRSDEYVQPELVSLIRDAAAAVPEIGELCAPIIHLDAELICAAIDVQWCRDRMADQERHGPHPNDRPEWIVDVRRQLAGALAIIAERDPETARGREIKDRYRAPAAQAA